MPSSHSDVLWKSLQIQSQMSGHSCPNWFYSSGAFAAKQKMLIEVATSERLVTEQLTNIVQKPRFGSFPTLVGNIGHVIESTHPKNNHLLLTWGAQHMIKKAWQKQSYDTIGHDLCARVLPKWAMQPDNPSALNGLAPADCILHQGHLPLFGKGVRD